jgi:hypothetical protein
MVAIALFGLIFWAWFKLLYLISVQFYQRMVIETDHTGPFNMLFLQSGISII